MSSNRDDTPTTNTTTTATTSAEEESRAKKSSEKDEVYNKRKEKSQDKTDGLPDIHLVDEYVEPLLKLPYYHGLLPREDVNLLLTTLDSFLVRLSLPQEGEQRPREVVLSINIDSAASHIVIHQKEKRYFLEDQKEFKDIGDLVEYYGEHTTKILQNHLLKWPVNRQKWQLYHKDIQLEEKIGSGNFGQVYCGYLASRKSKTEDNKVAIKICQGDHSSKRLVQEIMAEARIMRYLDHPNVVKLIGLAIDQEPIMIIMRFVGGGSLQSYLRKNARKISSMEKLEVMVLGSARGVQYIHHKKILHRDIAARNLLYNTLDNSVLLTDFGMSREGTEFCMEENTKIAFKHLSPETLRTYKYTVKTDVYSFGVLVWEIYTDGHKPYPEKRLSEVRALVEQGNRLEFPKSTPSKVKELVCYFCWTEDPDTRWNMDQIVGSLEKIVKKRERKSQVPTSVDGQDDIKHTDNKLTNRASNSRKSRSVKSSRRQHSSHGAQTTTSSKTGITNRVHRKSK